MMPADRSLESTSPQDDRTGNADMDRYPDFVIAGAARSGTTALAGYLANHPRVEFTKPKEPHYLALRDATAFAGPGDDAHINKRIIRNENAYRALFPPQNAGLLRGEGSVSSLYYHQEAIATLTRLNARARVIILLRDPADRAFSAYQYLRVRGLETAPTFSEGLALEESRRSRNWHHLWHYSAMSRYGESVSAWIGAFGRRNVGIWSYEDLITQDEGVLGEVLDFLGLPTFQAIQDLGAPVNVSGDPRSQLVASLMSTMSKSATIRRAVRGLTPLKAREAIRRSNLRAASVSTKDRRTVLSALDGDIPVVRRLLTDHGYRLPKWLPDGTRLS